MKTPLQKSPDWLHTELSPRLNEIIQWEQGAIDAMLNSFKECKREESQRHFEKASKLNALRELAQDWLASLRAPHPLTYAVDAWFLRDVIRHLTPGADEEISYVTGPKICEVLVMSRICAVQLAKQSAVYALGTAQSCADALIEILGQGNRLHVMAHSHPGRGAGATHPSSIDVNYLGRIQRNGADVIGIIVTRDGFVRFFTVEKPFRVLVQGSGVTQVEDHVYQIELSQKNRH